MSSAPKPSFAKRSLPRLYDALGQLIDSGTGIFLTDAPPVLSELAAHKDLHELRIAPINNFARIKLIGEPGAHVLYLVQWPAGFSLPPHEHGGKPGIDYVLSGRQAVTDWKATRHSDGRYALSDLRYHTLTPGQHAVVDPRVTDIHSVRAIGPTRSLHVYPVDCQEAFIYVPDGKRFRRASIPLEQQVLHSRK